MAIHEWPEDERPRERFLRVGPSALSDAELLAIIIGSGSRGRSAVDVGRDLLKKFGSLRALLNADQQRCLKQLGIGPVRFVMLKAALELARRHQLDLLRTAPVLSVPMAAADFLRQQLRDRPYELFCCLYLDAQHRFIAFEEIFRGTTTEVHVYAREVARQVVVHNAVGVILAHNHPSGLPEPSSADKSLTRRLREALSLLNVSVLDHIVVGDSACVSFAQRGWI